MSCQISIFQVTGEHEIYEIVFQDLLKSALKVMVSFILIVYIKSGIILYGFISTIFAV